MLPYFNKKIGEVIAQGIRPKIIWITMFCNNDIQVYRLQFNLTNWEDDELRVPLDKFKMPDTTGFQHRRVTGGRFRGHRFPDYHKYHIDCMDINKLKEIINFYNSNVGEKGLTIKITKDIDVILNEYRVLSI